MEQQLSLFDFDATLAPRPYEVSLLEVARKISHQFWASQSPTAKQLRSWMTQAFGGSDAEGRWSWKDVCEAQEAAFVLLSKEWSKSLLQGSATDVLQRLALVESLGRTHAQRSEESVALQQFSTPPQLAYLVVECAQIRATDIVLEPSAGTGILAILAQTRGATVILNELSERRRAILGKLFPRQAAYSFDGERIHDCLPQEIRPTVVVMNPPFSASPHIDHRHSRALSQHVRSAFGRLAPGGRLVLISARWFSPGKPEWESAFRGLSDVRVSLAAAVDGAAYAKHGTSMETRLTVIDKTVPSAGNPPVELHLHFGLSPHRNVRSFRPHEVERLFAALPQRPEDPAVKPEPKLASERDRGASASEREETSPPRPSSPSATQLAVALELKLEPEVVSASELGRESTFPSPPQTLRGMGRGGGEKRLGDHSQLRTPNSVPLTYDLVERTAPPLGETLYEVYQPQRIRIAGAQPHPTTLCESAALASVKPPIATYAPHLPRAVVEKGQLSEAQLESVVYAGEAHSQLLRGFFQVNESFDKVEVTSSDAPEAVQFRRGWFLGDGTGAGKGRQLAGILLDNWCRGRQKALWLSKSDKLLEDARRDWSALGGDETDIVPLSRYQLGEAISLPTGIIFTTYATLRGQRPGKKSRLQQLIDWLGKDFDGVIAFDESHAMGNAIAEVGIRGSTGASQQGLTGLRLQNALPQARVLYVSATGATKVMNLAYATRLGLWQTGDFPFANRGEFIHAIEAGGVAAMEVVARDLKALGLYVARNLSFDGVEYEALEVPLTPEQIAIYDAYAEAFQVIHTHLESALEACNIVGSDGKTQNRHAKMAAKSMFESHKQRFFNHLITAMKCPALLRSIEEDLKNGYAAIVQLVSTSESLMKRRLAQIPVEEWNDLNIDITPREYVMDYLVCAFPIHLYETYTTDSGELLARQVQDAEGNPVVSQEALTLRNQLVERLASLPPLPGALDQLLHHFGHEAIAEVTGRSQRILCERETGRQYVSHRPASANWEEAQAFMDGEKLILIFSDAGGTGRSYHADLCCQNTKRRIHYLLESGWRADNAVQGLGRSHRTNQASAPIFRPVVTDVKGERRFISTISRRLDALGALTRGSRQTGGQGLFDPKDNLESAYAEAALKQFFFLLSNGQMQVCSLARFETATGLSLATPEGRLKQELPSISQFLNRILALPIQLQNDLFEVFEILLEAKVEAAMAMGTYETGVETLRAERLTVKSRETVYTHPTGGETVCVEIEKLERNPIVTSEAALALSRDREGVLLVNERSGRAAVKIPTTSTANAEGAIVPRVALVRPSGRVKLLVSEFENTTWRAANRREWQRLWDAEAANAPEFISSRFFLMSGLLLPIWNSLDADNLRVFRLQADTGERLLGRTIEPDAMPAIAQALGLRQVKLAPAEIFEQVMAKRQRYQLSGGLSLKASAVMSEVRLEVVGSHISDGLCEQLKAVGCFTEIIQYRRRVFVPANAQLGAVVIEKVLELLH
jgi:P-loop containing NTP hydrolase pore-1/C-terminal domain on Strawberry notch homologue